MGSTNPSRLGQLRRHLRRAHARWRLHRMEWNSMHSPLEPPKGYEHFHTEAAVFPGYSSRLTFRSWKEFKECLRGGFKLYMHHYFPDPDIVEAERRAAEQEKRETEERVEKMFSKAAEAAEAGRQKSEEVAQALHDATPAAKLYLQDRMTVLQKAVSEFAAGFQETISGEKNIWGQESGAGEDYLREDNPPVVYRTQQSSKNQSIQ